MSFKNRPLYACVGDAGLDLVVLTGKDTIGATAVDTRLVEHAYFAACTSVIADPYQLVKNHKKASERLVLLKATHVATETYGTVALSRQVIAVVEPPGAERLNVRGRYRPQHTFDTDAKRQQGPI